MEACNNAVTKKKVKRMGLIYNCIAPTMYSAVVARTVTAAAGAVLLRAAALVESSLAVTLATAHSVRHWKPCTLVGNELGLLLGEALGDRLATLIPVIARTRVVRTTVDLSMIIMVLAV
jgi:hypothetical protein